MSRGRAARVAAQAKVNLRLRVGRADATGYHVIETVFQRIDLADDVVVRATPGAARSLDVDGPALPAGGLGPVEQNLSWRAALAYCGAGGWPAGFAIELVKRIPTGGGLGGGSADAAGVLRGLDALAPRPLGEARLLEIGAAIGADVPFLTSSHVRALGTGRGERLAPARALPPAPVALVIPGFSVATAEAYRWLDDDHAGTLADAARPTVPPDASAESWDEVAAGAHNDFEGPVERRHPVLRRVRHALASSGARIALLSGSGSTVFGVFAEPVQEVAELPADMRVVHTHTAARVVPVRVEE